jgi:hypothetical protein
MSEVNEMRNRMREKGVNACLNYLPNPRLPFPSPISLKKKKKKLAKASSCMWALGSVFIVGSAQGASTPSSGSVRSLQNQGAQFFPRELFNLKIDKTSTNLKKYKNIHFF